MNVKKYQSIVVCRPALYTLAFAICLYFTSVGRRSTWKSERTTERFVELPSSKQQQALAFTWPFLWLLFLCLCLPLFLQLLISFFFLSSILLCILFKSCCVLNLHCLVTCYSSFEQNPLIALQLSTLKINSMTKKKAETQLWRHCKCVGVVTFIFIDKTFVSVAPTFTCFQNYKSILSYSQFFWFKRRVEEASGFLMPKIRNWRTKSQCGNNTDLQTAILPFFAYNATEIVLHWRQEI